MVYDFHVSVSAERLLAMYSGDARYLIVWSKEGLKLQLPLGNFRPFVTDEGLQGLFQVTVDQDNKLQSLKKLSD